MKAVKEPISRFAAIQRVLEVITVLGAAVMLSGCLYPGMGGRADGSRHNVDVSVPSKLQLGVTTMEEVLLLLGEPDRTEGDRRFSYSWAKVYVWSPDYEGKVTREYQLHIDFEISNRVSHVDVCKNWLSTL